MMHLAVRTAAVLLAAWAAAPAGFAEESGAPPFERTETREPCAHHDPLRQPWFGDLHVHTSYSFDSYPLRASATTPGMPTATPRARPSACSPTIRGAPGGRGLAWSARWTSRRSPITPSSWARFNICTEDAWQGLGTGAAALPRLTRPARFILQLLRRQPTWVQPGHGQLVERQKTRKSWRLQPARTATSCAKAGVWERLQQAAEEHYDRSAECSFTTFVAYEYTDAPEASTNNSTAT